MAVDAPVDPAQGVFEPTGDLFKDYCAYCETADLDERDDLLDGIALCDEKAEGGEDDVIYTHLFVRRLETQLYRKDMAPLSNAMPHCANLFEAKFYRCSLTLDSFKLLTEAVYKSPSIRSLAVDFNQTPLGKDPTVSRKERPDYYVWPHQYRGAARHELMLNSAPAAADKAKAPAKGKAPAQEEPPPTLPPVKLPDGWSALLLTGIERLSLRGNGISDRQARQFAQALATATSLKALNLWGNAIGDEGAAAFAETLLTNSRLTALNLGNNRMSDTGMLALVSTMVQRDVAAADLAEARRPVREYQELMTPGADNPMPGDPPAYPAFLEYVTGQPPPPEGGAKKPPPKGKGKEEPKVLPSAWDRGCYRHGEDTVRIPQNISLWSLNVSGNRGLTEAGVIHVHDMLAATQSALEAMVSQRQSATEAADRRKSAAAAPPSVSIDVPPLTLAGCGLERLVLAHPAVPDTVLEMVDETMKAIAALHETLRPEGPP